MEKSDACLYHEGGGRNATLSMSLAMSTEMTEAAQPMPDRFTVRMLDLNLKCFTTAADREGVGLKAVQLTISPSICEAHCSL